MTLDYLYCEKHFKRVTQSDTSILDMFEANEKEGWIEFIPGNCCSRKGDLPDETPCGEKGYAIVKFKVDCDDGRMNPVNAIPYRKEN